MGNYRFRLSDMIPNAWFYKLKYITKTKTQTTTNRKHHHPTTTPAPPPPPLPSKHHHSQQPRKSYHLTREKFAHNSTTESTTHCPDPPRKSSKKRRTTRPTTRSSPRLVTTTISASCSCRTTLNSVWTKPDSTPEEYPNSPLDTSSEKESLLPELGPDNNAVFTSSTCPCKFEKETTTDFDKSSIPSKFENLSGFDLISESNILPPIITKAKEPANSANYEERDEYESFITKQQRACSVRRFSVSSPAGVKLRTNSPRMKIQGYGRRSVSSGSRRSISESVAVVKRSEDPQKDFKESMVEMIMENNIRTSKDLEDLLACYLSLNSDEYHELIIKVFKQIWFDVTDVRLK